MNRYGYHQLKGVSEPETRARESLRRIMDLYDAWQAAEPDACYDSKASRWWAKPDAFHVQVRPLFLPG